MLDLAVEHIKGLQSELQVIYIPVHVYKYVTVCFFYRECNDLKTNAFQFRLITGGYS